MMASSNTSEMESYFVGNIGPDANNTTVKDFFAENGITAQGVDIKNGYAFVYVNGAEHSAEEVIDRIQGREINRTGRFVVIQRSKNGLTAKLREEKRRETLVPTETLFVAGLDVTRTTEDDIRQGFSKYGEVKDVDIKKSFCFVSFFTVDDATRALNALHGTDWRGRVISIEYSKTNIIPRRARGLGGMGGGGVGVGGGDGYREDSRERDPQPHRMRSSGPGVEGPPGQGMAGSYPGPHLGLGPGPMHGGGLGVHGGPPGASSGAGMPPIHLHDSVTQSAIRDREIADAFIRMKEWEAYYYSLVAERDAALDQSAASYARPGRPSDQSYPDHRENREVRGRPSDSYRQQVPGSAGGGGHTRSRSRSRDYEERERGAGSYRKDHMSVGGRGEFHGAAGRGDFHGVGGRGEYHGAAGRGEFHGAAGRGEYQGAGVGPGSGPGPAGRGYYGRGSGGRGDYRDSRGGHSNGGYRGGRGGGGGGNSGFYSHPSDRRPDNSNNTSSSSNINSNPSISDSSSRVSAAATAMSRGRDRSSSRSPSPSARHREEVDVDYFSDDNVRTITR